MSHAHAPCYETLRHEILSGAIPAGERLASERRLAEQFDVNRVTVRNALGRLEASRLIRARRGAGWVVQDYRAQGGPELIGPLVDLLGDGEGRDALATDLLLVRRQLATAVLMRLASSPPRASAIAQVAATIEAFTDAVAQGAEPAQLAQLDLEIVAALLEATESAVLGLFLNPVASALERLPRLRDAIYERPETNVAGWRALMAWLLATEESGVSTIAALLESRDIATLQAMKGTS